MNVMGFTRKSRMQSLGETLLWSGLAIGAGVWLMKEHGNLLALCHCQDHSSENNHCGCGNE